MQRIRSHQKAGRPDEDIDYAITETLHSMAVDGQGGRHLVEVSLSPEARDVLQNLCKFTWVNRLDGEEVASWVHEILHLSNVHGKWLTICT